MTLVSLKASQGEEGQREGGQQLYVENKNMQHSSQNKNMKKKKEPRGNEESGKKLPKTQKKKMEKA